MFIPSLPGLDPRDSCNVAMVANTVFTERFRLQHYTNAGTGAGIEKSKYEEREPAESEASTMESPKG